MIYNIKIDIQQKIYNKIKKSTGPVFVYSNFKEYGGLKSFILFLENKGYYNYKNKGIGKKRYAVWSGDSKLEYREKGLVIKPLNYNSKNFLEKSKQIVIDAAISRASQIVGFIKKEIKTIIIDFSKSFVAQTDLQTNKRSYF